MAFERIKRNRYFHPSSDPTVPPVTFNHTGEHHHQDQEEFSRPLVRADSAHLRGDWGIADGLAVTGAPGDTTVAVAGGIAVDKPGETIVLATSGTGDIGTNPPGNEHQEVAVPVSLPLGSQAGTFYVTIQHNEISRGNEGSGGRFEQVPWIRLQATGTYVNDGVSVILAIVDVAAGGSLGGLRFQDAGLPFGRRLLGRRTGPVQLKRRQQTGNTVDETITGAIDALEGGGLRLSVPNTGDAVRIERDGGGTFARLDVHADDIMARNAAGQATVEIDTAGARLVAGSRGVDGDVEVQDAAGITAVQLRGGAHSVHVRDGGGREVLLFNGNVALLRIGTEGSDGDLHVQDHSGRSAFQVTGADASLGLGTAGNGGDLTVRDGAGRTAMFVHGDSATVNLGTEGNGGDLTVVDNGGRVVMHLQSATAQLFLGAAGNDGDLRVRNSAGQDTIVLDGDSGAFITGQLFVNNIPIMGNPARQVTARRLFADNGSVTAEVNFGSRRQFSAFVAMTGCDPRHNFDRGDAFALDIFSVDGVRTGSFLNGGDHFGPAGDPRNVFAQTFAGVGQRILFRARSFQDATVFGIMFVFFE